MNARNFSEYIAGLVIGIILTTSVYAAGTIIDGNNLSYNNKTSGGSYSDVQNSIDELYKKTENINSNENIVSAYIYSESGDNICITGDENTCKPTTCYKKNSETCPPGTIIEYNVKKGEKIRFHVIKDNGNTITLQSQKNTVYNTAWYTEQDNSKGPITILSALEEKTNNWTNVNTLSYSIGDAKSTLGYSGCNSILQCVENKYQLTKSNVKARMITMQEAYTLGCRNGVKTCPIWMYNYLKNSTSNDGTVNDTHTENNATENLGYWTMNTYATYDVAARFVRETGTTNDWVYCDTKSSGARAVIEINK